MAKIQVGDVFERWTVTGRSKHKWLTLCVCGKTGTVSSYVLLSGKSKSCGCYQRDVRAAQGRANRKHGMEGTPEYTAWAQLKSRCQNPHHSQFKDYGARGISVCARWQSFENFIADMGPRPPGKGPSGRALHSIDRIDNDGNYEPSNCRWATTTQQQHNRRDNTQLTDPLSGRTQTAEEWMRELAISPRTLSRWRAGNTLHIRIKHSRPPHPR